MRAFAILVAAVLPAIAAAQNPYIPQPIIPQTSVPGVAGYPGGHLPYAPGVGVGIVAPIQGGAGALIVAPGQSPSYILTPEHTWGSAIVAPGMSPTYVVPSAGGTAIFTPDYGTTLIRPNPAGGTTIIGPDQPATLIVPTQQGGSVILGPTGTGYVVPTPHGTYIQPPGSAPPAVIYHH